MQAGNAVALRCVRGLGRGGTLEALGAVPAVGSLLAGDAAAAAPSTPLLTHPPHPVSYTHLTLPTICSV
eukprot:1220362-Rhodomonas_salina.1